MPTREDSLSGKGYLRTVEDAGPYEFNLFVGFKYPANPQFPSLKKNRAPFAQGAEISDQT